MNIKLTLRSSYYKEVKVDIMNYVSEELRSKNTCKLTPTERDDCISVKLIWKWS